MDLQSRKNKSARRRRLFRPQTFLTIVGRKLRLTRAAADIPLESVAKDLGISVMRLREIERGTRNYSLELLVKMCEYYGISGLDIVG